MDGQNDNGGSGDFTQAVNDLTNNDQGQGQAPANDQGPAPTPGWGHPSAPADDSSESKYTAPPPDQTAGPAPVIVPPVQDGQAPVDDASLQQLGDLKQKALGDLTPLVEHLDQSQEEKFTTIMMMLQASDDQRLLQKAYDTAQKIQDEKVRAQALLDVVNEINYFTQKAASPTPQS